MKKVILFCLVSLITISCSSDDDGIQQLTDSPLVGTWNVVSIYNETDQFFFHSNCFYSHLQFEFKPDYTFDWLLFLDILAENPCTVTGRAGSWSENEMINTFSLEIYEDSHVNSPDVGKHVEIEDFKIEFNEDETEMTWYYEYVNPFNQTLSMIATYERIDELNLTPWDD